MEPRANGSSTVQKALTVLEAVAVAVQQRPEGATLSELGRAAGFTVSSTYRYLKPLLSFGLVSLDAERGRYRLGLRMVELAGICLQSINLRNVARPFAEELTRQTQETVYLGVPDGVEVVYLERIDSPLPVRPHTNLGGRNPLHSTALGKAMLAEDPELAARVMARPLSRRTPRTLTTMEALAADLDRTRVRGYAIDDLENESEVRCVGAAIKDFTGAVAGAISVSGPANRLSLERIISEIGPRVSAAAKDISRAMGCPSREEDDQPDAAQAGDGRGEANPRTMART